MFKHKNVISVLLAVVLLLGGGLISFAITESPGDIKVVIDGKTMNLSVPPVKENNMVFIPVKQVYEQLGAVVKVNKSTKSVNIKTPEYVIDLNVNQKTAYADNKPITLTAPVKLVRDTALAPLSLFERYLGSDIKYSDSTGTITITYFTKMTGTLKVGGSTTVQPVAQAAADKLMSMNKNLSISVAGGGSGKGITDTASGAFNVGNASKELSASDKATYPDLIDTKIGSDGIAVIVNKANKIKNLTRKQVFDIFTGKITNWKNIGGNNAPIFIQDREVASGTRVSFLDLAIYTIDKDKKASIVASATPHNSNGLVLNAVAANKNAIGYISFGYINSKIKPVSIDGIDATVANAVAFKYPYVRPLNVLTKGKPSGLAAKWINFLLSPEGQALLEKENYMKLPGE